MNDPASVGQKPVEESENSEVNWQESVLCHRQMLRALPVAVYTFDSQGRVTLFNRTAARLWGREPELNKDLWCGSWRIFKLDGTPMPLEHCPMARTIRDRRAVHCEEILVERPDGTRRHVLPYPEPIRNSSGAVVGAINTLVDLTTNVVEGVQHAVQSPSNLSWFSSDKPNTNP